MRLGPHRCDRSRSGGTDGRLVRRDEQRHIAAPRTNAPDRCDRRHGSGRTMKLTAMLIALPLLAACASSLPQAPSAAPASGGPARSVSSAQPVSTTAAPSPSLASASVTPVAGGRRLRAIRPSRGTGDPVHHRGRWIGPAPAGAELRLLCAVVARRDPPHDVGVRARPACHDGGRRCGRLRSGRPALAARQPQPRPRWLASGWPGRPPGLV